MKLCQVSVQGEPLVGVMGEDGVHPVKCVHFMEDFIRDRPAARASVDPLSVQQISWMPVVTGPSKIIGVGLNYRDHIEESKGTPPSNPVIFAKYPNSLLGHKGVIQWDARVTGKVDFEAELAVVIGKRVKGITESEAREAVFGYTCANDVSARDLQFGDGQWTRGKTLDTFCPLGPAIVTADEMTDPQGLHIQAILNGRVMQDANTSQMIFGVYALISHLSRSMTLMPGDVILTGTPSGVGAFRDPPIYLKDGDEIVVRIEGIGELVNRCRVVVRS